MGTREIKGREGERDRVRVKKPGDVILLARVIFSRSIKKFSCGSAAAAALCRKLHSLTRPLPHAAVY